MFDATAGRRAQDALLNRPRVEAVDVILEEETTRTALVVMFFATVSLLAINRRRHLGEFFVDRMSAHRLKEVGEAIVPRRKPSRKSAPSSPPAKPLGVRVLRSALPAALHALASGTESCQASIGLMARFAESEEDAVATGTAAAAEHEVMIIDEGETVLLVGGEEVSGLADLVRVVKPAGSVVLVAGDDPVRGMVDRRLVMQEYEPWRPLSDEEVAATALKAWRAQQTAKG